MEREFETDEEMFKVTYPNLMKVFTFQPGGGFGEIALIDKSSSKR